jgi:hypothetical protein
VSRFPKPALDVLPLANGDTITVRRALTHGETLDQFARMYQTTRDGAYVYAEGRPVVDPLKTGDAVIVAYLVDWTIRDDDDAVIPIRGLSPDELADVIRNLDHESAVEIRAAIQDHEIRQRQKKTVRPPLSVAI